MVEGSGGHKISDERMKKAGVVFQYQRFSCSYRAARGRGGKVRGKVGTGTTATQLRRFAIRRKNRE